MFASLELSLHLQIALLMLLLLYSANTAIPKSYKAGQEGIEAYENYFNGIHVEDENADIEMRNAIKSPHQLWPERTLYYKISSNYSAEEVANVHQALRVFEQRTCLTFKPYTDDVATERYILYNRSPNLCGTKVGYQPGESNIHEVLLNGNCLSKIAVIQHETLHVLGLYHEQSRPDRNDYVRVEYMNIAPKYWPQFLSYPHTTTHDVPYDYQSLMHYSAYAFASNPKKPTLRARLGNTIVDQPMGQLIGPAESDLKKINIMYKCEM